MNNLHSVQLLKRNMNYLNTTQSTKSDNSKSQTSIMDRTGSISRSLLKFDKLKSSTNFLNNTFNPVTIKNALNAAEGKNEKIGQKEHAQQMSLLSLLMEDATKKQKLDVNVKSLASQQVNQTTAVNANSPCIIDDIPLSGSNEYTFKLDCAGSAGTSKEISVKLTSEDKAKDILNKISKAINSSASNVKSEVISTPDNKMYLKLISNDTGETNKFSLTDIKGKLASKLGLNNVVQKAGNAVYTIDGKELTSSSNKIWVANNTLQVELLKTGESNLKIDIEEYLKKIKGNKDNIIDHLSNGVDSCNLLDKDLDAFTNKSKSSLSNLGIELNKENKLVFNKDFLRTQMKSNMGMVTNSMIGKGGGLDFFNSVSNNIFSTPPMMSNPYLRNSHILHRGSFSDTF